MPVLSGNLSAAGAGLQVSAYKLTRLGAYPTLTTDLTGITVDAGPVTADGAGAWALTTPTAEPYYLRFVSGGLTVGWEVVNAQPFGTSIAAGLSGPGVLALAAWSYDKRVANNTGSALASGTLAVARVPLLGAVPLSRATFVVSTVGATLTAGQNAVGVYDQAGNLLSQANADAVFIASGIQTLSLPPFTTPGGDVFVAFLSVGTTPPQLLRVTGTSNNAGEGASFATFRGGTASTGLTALPSPLLAASLAPNASLYWAGLS
jgi:hypothetical protein